MRRAASRAIWTAGSSKATRTPMMAMTTSSSTSVKPATCRRRNATRAMTSSPFLVELHLLAAAPRADVVVEPVVDRARDKANAAVAHCKAGPVGVKALVAADAPRIDVGRGCLHRAERDHRAGEGEVGNEDALPHAMRR